MDFVELCPGNPDPTLSLAPAPREGRNSLVPDRLTLSPTSAPPSNAPSPAPTRVYLAEETALGQLDMPDGYEIRPHHHPMGEHISVVKGHLWLGRGKDWDDKKLSPLAVGDAADVAAKEPHYVRATLRTVIEVRSTGPFEITYINPADDPRKVAVE